MMDGIQRELTRAERSAIRKLVKNLCANYDPDKGCLPLDDVCYMINCVAYTNSGLCKYFRNSVLPEDPVLESALTGSAVKMRECLMCGVEFPANGQKKYCSPVCADNALRKQKRNFIRKKRGRV